MEYLESTNGYRMHELYDERGRSGQVQTVFNISKAGKIRAKLVHFHSKEKVQGTKVVYLTREEFSELDFDAYDSKIFAESSARLFGWGFWVNEE